jgi:hypothetical protein
VTCFNDRHPSSDRVGAPADIDELQRKVNRLEQAQIDLTAQLGERAEELRAAREANRELTRALNQRRDPT